MEKTMTENKLKHTPGPWTYFFKHKYKEWHVGLPRHGYHLDLFPNGFPGTNMEEIEANARLVSCAPEMLEALIEQCRSDILSYATDIIIPFLTVTVFALPSLKVPDQPPLKI